MNNKGFTMIELLAVIVILSILGGLATASIIGVQERINERTYNALLDEIKVAAENYTVDTNFNLFFVDKLIDDGRIEAEDDGNIYDPRDKSKRLNCYVVEVNFENGQYVSEIDEDSEFYDLGDDCVELPNTISLEYENLGLAGYGVFSTYQYKFTIECTVGLDFLFTSNRGYYERKTCIGSEEDNISIPISNDELPLTFSVSFRSPEKNIIKTRYVTIPGK